MIAQRFSNFALESRNAELRSTQLCLPFISELLSIMDSLPPNDPNNHNNNQRPPTKEAPFDGRQGSNNGQNQGNGAPMDMLGNLEDSPAVVAMFLIGVATWFLRERCIC
jgi:hypothetical protein